MSRRAASSREVTYSVSVTPEHPRATLLAPAAGTKKRSLRSIAAKLAVACLLAGSFSPAAYAQTAHLAFVQLPVANNLHGDTRVAVDSAGNVYVTDGQNVFKETPQPGGGFVQSLVVALSNPSNGPMGVAVDAGGNVYVSTWFDPHVYKETPPLSLPGTYTQTEIAPGFWFRPGGGIAIDSHGNIYVADTGLGVIMVPTTDQACSTLSDCTVVGSGASGGINIPYGVAVDSSDNVYIADTGNQRVLQVPSTDLTCATPSDCTAVNTVSSQFRGVAVGGGNLYIADPGNGQVLKVLLADLACATPSNCTTVSTYLAGPQGVAVDSNGNIFISNNGDGTALEIPFVNDSASFGSILIGNLTGVATFVFQFDTGGTLGSTYALTQGQVGFDFQDAGGDSCQGGSSYNTGDMCTRRVQFAPRYTGVRYGAVVLDDNSGNTFATAYAYGTGYGSQVTFQPGTLSELATGQINAPRGVAVAANGDLFVGAAGDNQVVQVAAGSGYTAIQNVGSGFSSPYGVAVDGAGNVFVADNGNNQVKEIVATSGFVNSSSTVNTLAGSYSIPYAVAVDKSGNVYVADSHHHAVKEILAAGGYTTVNTLGGGFTAPFGVAVDISGNVFVADYTGNTVKEIPLSCINPPGANDASCVLTLGSGFSLPRSVALDENGNLFVGEETNNDVKELTAASGYTTIIPITLTNGPYNKPFALAVSGAGDIFIASTNDGDVEKLDLSDGPTLYFTAPTTVGSPSGDSPQTVTLSNTGNAPLIFEIPAFGTDPSIATGFTLDSSGGSACPFVGIFASAPGTLASGASCTLPISFTPVLDGSLNGSLVLTDNALNQEPAQQFISLNGTGTAGPAAQLVFATPPPSLISGGNNAGNITVNVQDAGLDQISGWSTGVTLTVTGPAGYSQSYGPSDASSGSVSFDLSAVPLTTAGVYTYTATSSPLTPAVATETLLTTQPVNVPSTTLTATVQITSTFTIGSISVVTQGATGLDYAFAPGGTCIVSGSYMPGDSCTVNYTFTPLFPGVRNGAIVLNDSTPTAQATTYLTGTGNGSLAAIYSPTTQTPLGSLLSLPFNDPQGVTVDVSGNIYIADVGNNRVLQIPPTDLACTTPSDCIEVGSNVTGALSGPSGVVVDGAGNIYISDAGNNRVVKVPPTDLTCATPSDCTFVGTNLNGPGPMAMDGAGALYVIDRGNSRVLKIPATDPTCTTSCSDVGGILNTPSGIAVDGDGNVFISEPNFGAVVEIPPSDLACAISCINVAGGGFSLPYGLALDAGGNLYITATGTGQVVIATPSAGNYVVSGFVPAGGLNTPAGIALDGAGNVYVTDTNNNQVFKLDTYDPTTLAFPSTYVGYSPSQAVTLLSIGNEPFTIPVPGAGSNPALASGPAAFSLDASSTCPQVNLSSAAGTLAVGAFCSYVVDFVPPAATSYIGSVALTSYSQNSPQTISLTGTATDQIPTQLVFATPPPPTAIPVGAGGNAGIVKVNIESSDNFVDLISTAGVTLTVIGPAGYSHTYGPTAAVAGVATFDLSAVALTTPGTYTYTATSSPLTDAVATEVLPLTEPVHTTSSSQTATVTFASSFTLSTIRVVTQGITGLDFNIASGGTCITGHAYNATDTCTVNYTFTPTIPGARYGAIVFSDSTPTVQATVNLTGTGTGPLAVFYPGTYTLNQSTLLSLSHPDGIAVDPAGNLYIADSSDSLIYKETLSGGTYTQSILTSNVSGLTETSGVALDSAGNVFISNAGSQNVLLETLNADGSYTESVAISGLNQPTGLAVDSNENLYIADEGNDEVYKETYSGGAYTQITIVNSLNRATDVAVDSSGNVYIADDNDNQLLKETPSGAAYIQSVVADGNTSVSDLKNIKVDGNGNIYFLNFNGGVYRETPSGGSYVQTGVEINGNFATFGFAVDSVGNMYGTGAFLGGEINKIDVSDPPSFNFFTPTLDGRTDGSDGVMYTTLWNLGNAALTFSVPGSGSNPSIGADFQFDSTNTCPVTASGAGSPGLLAIGTSCTVGIYFAPTLTVTGAVNESLVFADNSPVTTQSIALIGTGVPALTVNTTTLPDGTAGVAYSQTISVSGGTTPYAFSILTGSLPAGLSIDSSAGSISGTPTAFGSFSFTVQVSDNSSPTPFSQTQAYTLIVSPPVITLTPASGALTGGTVGTLYGGAGVSPSGGNGPYVFDIASGGSLPPGLTIDSSSGSISGTPTGGGTFHFSIEAIDASTGSGPHLGIGAYSILIAAPTVTVTPATAMPDGADDGSSYPVQSLVAGGGTPPYTFDISTGSLPPGFTIDSSSGEISGSTTVTGIFNFTVRATDSSAGAGPYTGVQAYSITIDPGPTTQFGLFVPSPVYTGTPVLVTVTAGDVNGNPTPSYSGTVHLTSTDTNAVLSADGSLSGGTGNFSVTFAAQGGQTVSVIDTLNPGIAGTTNLINVIPQDIWVVNSNGSLSELYENGAAQSDTNAPTNAPIAGSSVAVVFDGFGSIWSAISSGVVQYDVSGSLLGTITGGGISTPTALAVDGFDDIWVANGNGSVSEIRGGSTITPAGGYVGGGLSGSNGIAIDISGNVWVSNAGNNSVTEIIGGAPPVLPLGLATENSSLGQLP